MKQAHQTIGNIIRTFQLNKVELDMDDPLEGILSAVIFVMQSTVHTTLGARPMQLISGWDAILNIAHETNWKLIKRHKQDQINKNNARDNSKHIDYTYQPRNLCS